MMKQLNRAETPPSITLRIGSAAAHSLQLRRGLRLKRPNVRGPRGPPGKSQNNGTDHQQSRISCLSKQPWGPTLVIQRQEMAAYFRLFGEGKSGHGRSYHDVDRFKVFLIFFVVLFFILVL